METHLNQIHRRHVLTAGVAASASLLSFPAMAQAYPSRPIRILIGIGAGGITDAIGRLYGQKISELLNTPVVVDNRPGAFQLPAIRALTGAAPDGYTLFLGNGSSLSLAPGVRKDVGYDPMKDFTFVALIGISSAVFTVHPDLPVRSMSELITYSAANPDKINYGSAGAGTSNHLKIEYLKSLSALRATHIPFKSDTDILRETAAGNIHMGLTTLQAAQPLIQAGKLRALAVTSPEPMPNLPGVPGTNASGIKGLEALEPYSYFGIVAPAGTPAAVVATLNAALNKVAEMPDVRSRMRESFFTEPSTSTPASFRELTQKELSRAMEVGKHIKLPE